MSTIPVMNLEGDRTRVEALLRALRLDPVEIALSRGKLADATEAVRRILNDVAERGDAAIVESSRKFDDPNFTIQQIRVTHDEMRDAVGRVPEHQMRALRQAIAQLRAYQTHVLPKNPAMLERPGVELGLRFTPLDSAGLYFPGGKAAYPSSLIHLAVPAQVAGVKQIAVCTPPSKYGR